MGEFISRFKGYKTYLTVAVAFVIGGLNYIGVIDNSLAEKIWTLLSFLGLSFVRAGIKNTK